MTKIFVLFAAVVAVSAPADSAPPRAGEAAIALPLTLIIPPRQRLCTLKAKSGLGYKVLRAAAGSSPSANATTVINYIGYLGATGAVFDQNVKSALPVGGVIPGFSEGLRMMQKGSIFRFCIPAALGYGGQATGPIPANSDLIFQVELLEIR